MKSPIGYILVDHWGPIDFQSPVIWPRRGMGGTGQTDDVILFEILGPKGKWRAAAIEGGSLSASTGPVPGLVEFHRSSGHAAKTKIALVYTGAKTTDYRGIESPAGAEVPFGYTDFFVSIDWKVRFYRWDKASQDPRTQPQAFSALIGGSPLAEVTTNRLDFAPGRAPRTVPNDYFATVAEGVLDIEPGDYILETTTDDGARVFLDDKPIVDEWHYQAPTLYSHPVHLAGRHRIRVEHFQIDGFWTLKVNLRPKNP